MQKAKKIKPIQQSIKIKAYTLNFSNNRHNNLIPFLVVFSLPVLLYLQTVTFGFTLFDDDQLISKHIDILKDFHNVFRAFHVNAFFDIDSPFYRPIQIISYMTDIQLSGGENTWMFHLSNIMLIGFCACLIYLLLKMLFKSQNLAFFGTLFYCIHPLFVSSVAWIPARGDLQLLFFSLLSVLFFAKFIKNKNITYLIYTWATFSIALFCKETAAFLPFLFLMYFIGFSTEKRIDKKYLLLFFLCLISGIFWFWLRFEALGGISQSKESLGFLALISNVRVIPESLTKFFLPFDNAPIPGFSAFKTIAGLIIIGLMVFLYFKKDEKTRKEKFFGACWFIILMLPPMLYGSSYIDYLDHRFLLPMVGILIFTLSLIKPGWFDTITNNKVFIFSSIFLLFGILTFAKSKAYSNPMTYYETAVAENPNSHFALNNLGNLKFKHGDVQPAIEYFTRAIKLDPHYDTPFLNRGGAYVKLGLYDKAVNDFTTCITLKPYIAEAYNNRGSAYYHQGKPDKAISDFNKAIELKPGLFDAYYNRGVLYDDQGLFNKAIADYSKAIILKPDNFDAYNNRGFAYYNHRLFKKAIIDYSNAIGLKPDNAEVYCNRGNSFFQLELFDKAVEDYSKVLELNPRYSSILINRGLTYLRLNLNDKACQDFKKSFEYGNVAAESFVQKYCINQ